jgi:hypothetical protein
MWIAASQLELGQSRFLCPGSPQLKHNWEGTNSPHTWLGRQQRLQVAQCFHDGFTHLIHSLQWTYVRPSWAGNHNIQCSWKCVIQWRIHNFHMHLFSYVFICIIDLPVHSLLVQFTVAKLTGIQVLQWRHRNSLPCTLLTYHNTKKVNKVLQSEILWCIIFVQ